MNPTERGWILKCPPGGGSTDCPNRPQHLNRTTQAASPPQSRGFGRGFGRLQQTIPAVGACQVLAFLAVALGAGWLALASPGLAAAKDVHAPPPATPASEQAAIDEARALVEELRSLQPAENTVQDGLLRIWEGRKLRAAVPVRCSVWVTASNWLSIYETLVTNSPTSDVPRPDTASLDQTMLPTHRASRRERLTVAHHPQAPNRYELEVGEISGARRRVLNAEELMQPFADSDFWIADLGLEFLHWPEQKVLRYEMKRGRSCVVLESRLSDRPAAGYVRVVSWLDRETGGIVQAEAFDARDRKLKEFAPKSFRKLNGRWQLQEMEIRNLQTGSRTRLEFVPASPVAPC